MSGSCGRISAIVLLFLNGMKRYFINLIIVYVHWELTFHTAHQWRVTQVVQCIKISVDSFSCRTWATLSYRIRTWSAEYHVMKMSNYEIDAKHIRNILFGEYLDILVKMGQIYCSYIESRIEFAVILYCLIIILWASKTWLRKVRVFCYYLAISRFIYILKYLYMPCIQTTANDFFVDHHLH